MKMFIMACAILFTALSSSNAQNYHDIEIGFFWLEDLGG